MLSKVTSFALSGLEGVPVEVETDVQSGLPGYELVGLPDAAVKESRERVRSALKNSGKAFPTRKVTVNLAPADLRKEGTYFDLAIAVGILAATGQLEPSFAAGYVFLGELALDGALRPVAGILPLLISAKAGGYRKFVIPAGNAREAAFLGGAPRFFLKAPRTHQVFNLVLYPSMPSGLFCAGDGGYPENKNRFVKA